MFVLIGDFMDRVILHCDLNSFFCSASLLEHPDLKGKAVAVCGDASKRHGIILAKSQPAKRAGIRTGEVIWKAKQLCPGLVLLPANYPLYMKLSKKVTKIYEHFTGKIEPFGIDECWLDITPRRTSDTYGFETAHRIREMVKNDTGLTVSVGVSWNKVFAKLGSDYRKPDAVTEISRENYKKLAWTLPCSDLIYVGRATRKKLEKVGVNTIGDIANCPKPFLKSLLGKNGLTLHDFASGNDTSPVQSIDHKYAVKGIGNSMTTVHDLTCDGEVKQAFLILGEMVAYRARKKRLQGSVLGIYLRDKNLAHITRQMSLNKSTFIADEIVEHAMVLYRANWDASKRPIRSIGVRLTRLSPIGKYTQMNFLDPKHIYVQNLEFAKDDIVHRFGKQAITRASLMKTTVAESNPKEQHVVHPLSFFRM